MAERTVKRDGFLTRIKPPQQIGQLLESIIVDLVIILVAYIAVFSARTIQEIPNYPVMFAATSIAAIIILTALYLGGIYHRIWARTSGHGITIIIASMAAATVLIAIGDLPIDPRPLPLSVIIIGNALALSGFVAVRYRSRLLVGASWRWKAVWNYEFPRTVTRVLIVGAGECGQELAWRFKHRSPTNDDIFVIVGFVDDDVKKRGMFVEGSKVLGVRKDIAQLADSHEIDLIVVAIHNIDSASLRDILVLCEGTKARIKIVPNVFALMNTKQGATLLRDVQIEDLIGRGAVSRHDAVDLSPMMDKLILVTGAAGSIGTELCRQLCSYPLTKLILVDNNESGLHELSIELSAKFPQTALIPVLADITIDAPLRAVFAKYRPQVVFHAAAYKHVPLLEFYPNEALRVNVGGTRKLAELAQAFGAERFVLISSDKAVNPSSVMGSTKRVCELILRALSQCEDNRTLFTSVRFGNVLGSRGSVVPTFNQQIDIGGPITVTHPDMTRYFMSMPEAANLVINAGCLTKGGDTFLLKMGEVVRIVDLAERMVRLRGLRPYEDIAIEFVGRRPGEKIHERLNSDAETLLDTLHPNINRLKSNDASLDAHEFWVRLDELQSTNLEDNPGALKELLEANHAVAKLPENEVHVAATVSHVA